MSLQKTELELRFGKEAEDCVTKSEKRLAAFDPDKSEASRDPTIIAAITVAGAAVSLAVELIKLAKELRSDGKKQGVVLVKINTRNEVVGLPLLEKSDEEIKSFVESD